MEQTKAIRLFFFSLLFIVLLASASAIINVELTNPIPSTTTNNIYIINNTDANAIYLNLSGTNANQDINIGSNSITASAFIGSGASLTSLSIYNATYAMWIYNQSNAAISNLNGSYGLYWYNQTIPAQTYTDVEIGKLNSSYIKFWYNQTAAALLNDYWALSGLSLYPDSSNYNIGIGTTIARDRLDLGGGTEGNGITWATNNIVRYSNIWAGFSDASLNIGIGVMANKTGTTPLYSYSGTMGRALITLDGFTNSGINEGFISFKVKSSTATTFNETSSLTELMRILERGVGIGTTAPNELLEVSNGNISLGTSNGKVIFYRSGAPANNQDFISTASGNSGTLGASARQSFVINIDSDNTATNNFFSIRKDKYDIDILTTDELFRVAESGNVGIGTAIPSSKLYINDTTGLAMTVEGGVSGIDIARFIRRNGAVTDFIISGAGGDTMTTYRTSTTNWTTGVDGSVYRISKGNNLDTDNYFNILTTGNTGVGVTNPLTTLHVNGTLRIINNTDTRSLQTDSNSYVGVWTSTGTLIAPFQVGMSTLNGEMLLGGGTSTLCSTRSANSFGFGQNVDCKFEGAANNDKFYVRTGTLTGASVLKQGISGNNAQLSFYTLLGNVTLDDQLDVIGNLRLTVNGSGYMGIGGNTLNPPTPLTVYLNDSSGTSIWASGNISAAGYITRSKTWNPTWGKASDQIIDPAKHYKADGKLNHSSFGVAYVRTPREKVIGYQTKQRTVEIEGVEEIEEYQEEIKATYYEEGTDLEMRVAILEGTVFELKKELCINKPNAYTFCGGIE